MVSVLRTTGISDVEAEELAILPGMEELSAMMYVNQFRREQRYDVIVLDCAPTAESMRFVSMPTTLEWYMKHIFPFQRGMLKAVRPIANRVSPVELPPDNYFANIQDLFGKLDGIGELLEDPKITSVRLVTNPERMVLRETQRAFVYFSLHGLTVDGVIVNRVLPDAVKDDWFQRMARLARPDPGGNRSLFRAGRGEARAAVHPRSAGPRAAGRTGRARSMARRSDPAAVSRTEAPYTFAKRDGHYEVRLQSSLCGQGRSRIVQEGRRTGGGDRHAAPAHRPAHLDGGACPLPARDWKIVYSRWR